ncbi:MAG: mechanosensitive ion channel [Erysipelotrichaceae bacterium]|nr:mechanosensitive ion channel [Erysipelotrichaceae bacterium]MDD3810137.1 mechanosensitive ion channel [Erysipelotrichaceae bacterium]
MDSKELLANLDKLFVDGAFNALITIVGVFLASKVLFKIIRKAVNRTTLENKTLIVKVIITSLKVIAVVIVLMQFTFTKSIGGALLASGGIVAVTIGLASQEAASGVVSGFMLTISKPFEIGDYISLPAQGIEGYIIQMNIRHSVVETFDKTTFIVPNATLNQSIIENYSYNKDYKVTRLTVSIAYEADIDKAIEIIKEEAKKHPLYIDVRQDPTQVEIPVIITALADSSINLRASITTKDFLDRYKVAADLNMAVFKRFKEEGIEIPYPHLHIIK